MTGSPIDRLLAAINKLDVDAATSLFAPEASILTADGRRAQGREALRELLASFFSGLRSITHAVKTTWHQDDAWIAEVEGTYELRDWLQLSALPRAFIVRVGPEGITHLHVYGAHEQSLNEHGSREEGMFAGARWVPPL